MSFARSVLLSYLIFLPFLNRVQAQASTDSLKYTLRIGYGMASVQEINAHVSNFDWFSSRDWQLKEAYGPIQLGFGYKTSLKEEVSLVVNYSAFRTEARRNPQTDPSAPPRDTEELLGTEKLRFYSILPTYTYKWRREKNLYLYSSLSAGVVYRTAEKWKKYEETEKSERFRYALHFTGLGIRMGNRVGGFLELGFGNFGILNGGLSVHL